MNIEKTYLAPIAIHPGETLADELEFLNLSQSELAKRTGISEKHISEIIHAKSSITPDIAMKIEKAIGLSAEGMLGVQASYEATLSRINSIEKLYSEVELLSDFQETYSSLKAHKFVSSFRWVEDNYSEIILTLQRFFGVDSLNYVKQTNLSAAYRKYKGKKINENSVAAWLRLGQIKSQELESQPFSAKKLESQLDRIRKLSQKKQKDYLPELEKILSDCGVVLVCAPYFKNSYTQGATQWVGKDKVFIILKTTNQREDKFWFNLFHEIGHILKHSKLQTFIDLEDNRESEEEKEADEFAKKKLLPGFSLSKITPLNKSSLEKTAKKFGVSVSIIAGRLEHEFQDYKGFKKFIKKMDDYQNVGVSK